MKRKPLILVTGATGAIGPVVVDVLHKSGYRIRTLALDTLPDNPWSKEAVESFVGDVTNPFHISSAVKGVDAVIHLAAQLHIVNPSEQLSDSYRKINVEGTRTLVEAVVRSSVNRIVLFSTIAVYGKSHGQIINEDTLPEPVTLYGQTKLEAEKIVLSALDAEGHSLGTVLRLAAVYGPRLKGNYEHLLEALGRGWFVPVGKGLNRRTLIYVKDAAEAAVLALSHPAAAGRVFNVSDGQYHSMNEIISAICVALGRRTPRFHIPIAPARAAAALAEDTASFLGFRSPLCRAMINTYTEDIAVESSLIGPTLGFQPRFDLIGGWQDAMQEMRRPGQGVPS